MNGWLQIQVFQRTGDDCAIRQAPQSSSRKLSF